MLARENALRPLRPCVKSIYNLFVQPKQGHTLQADGV